MNIYLEHKKPENHDTNTLYIDYNKEEKQINSSAMYSSFFSRIYIVDLWLVLVYHIYNNISRFKIMDFRKKIEIPQIPNYKARINSIRD